MKTLNPPHPTLHSPHSTLHAPLSTLSRPHAFTLTELLVVMAIIAILSAALGIVLAKLRTDSMVQRAKSDIQGLSNALGLYWNDIKSYPVAPWKSGYPPSGGFACEVLYGALTNKDAGGNNRGWGGATDAWDFITVASRTTAHFVDPWGLPYYYLSHDDYLRGVAMHDSSEDPGAGNNWPTVWGTTIVPIPYPQIVNGGSANMLPPPSYYGPAPNLSAFFNPNTFQLHSKGPDQKTDLSGHWAPTYITPCERGNDPDDITNWR